MSIVKSLPGPLGAAALLVAALVLTACGTSRSQQAQVVTPVPSSPTPAPGIRRVDFTQVSPLKEDLAKGLGDGVDSARILYSDLTGDGSEEAVVPIASGGTAGDTAYYVFGYQNGKPTALFVRKWW